MLGEAARFMKKPIGKVQQAMPKLLAMVEGGGYHQPEASCTMTFCLNSAVLSSCPFFYQCLSSNS